MWNWPALTPGGCRPTWDGTQFRVDGETRPILCYEAADSGWSDGLTLLHEETAGRDHYMDRASRKAALAEVASHQKAGAAILEVGSSSGYFLEELRESFPHAFVVGSDYFPECLFRLSQRLTGIPLVQMDVTRSPFDDGQFDAIVALNVLEHIQDDRTALSEIHRMLRPGGVAILEVPAGQHLFDYYDEHLKHFRRYALHDLRSMATSIGFEVVKASHLGFFLYPAFATVKLWSRLISRSMNEKERQERVGHRIRANKSSWIMNGLMDLELIIGSWTRYPCGIRCTVTLRKAHGSQPALPETERWVA